MAEPTSRTISDKPHYNDVIMSAMASQITRLTIVYSTVYTGANQRKHQSSASLAFVRGIHRWPVNSPHKGPVMRKMFTFDDVIMNIPNISMWWSDCASIVHRVDLWWCHQMEIFSALLALCAGNSPVTGGFPSQRPLRRSLDVFFDLAWTNGWANNRDAGDLRRHCSRCDVTLIW